MRVNTKNLSIKEIYDSKKELIATKKQTPIFSDAISYNTIKGLKPTIETKAEADSSNPNTLKVSLIGNTAMFCDSHMDVLGIGCFDKTVQERGNLVPHLVDHKHSLEAKLGKTLNVYTELINVKDFGIESDVLQTQVLKMDSELVRSWNQKVFQLYKDEAVDQHSIGMQYVKLELALNDAEYKEEFELWNKVFPQIINKEFVENRGYFWYVTEIKLFEISAVLFGSNELTPTTAIESTKEEVNQPLLNTDETTKDEAENDFTSEENKKQEEMQKRKNALLENY